LRFQWAAIYESARLQAGCCSVAKRGGRALVRMRSAGEAG